MVNSLWQMAACLLAIWLVFLLTITTVESYTATTSKSTAPSDYDCNFESGFCTWTQAWDDQFDWTRAMGSTGSALTGPSSDHTMGNPTGHYVYIETSAPRRVNDTARLVSKMVNSTGAHCLHFWYHMYGYHVYKLNVYLKSGTSYGTPIWQHTGPLYDIWYSADVYIQKYGQYQIVFEGVRGVGYNGDIALDDVKVTPGACTTTRQASNTTEQTVMSTDGPTQVRLVNGPDRYSGRVEVYYLGNWGTVCDDYFDDDDARVICRMLGYTGGHAVVQYFGSGTGPIIIDDLKCQGYENDIRYCHSSPWLNAHCSHAEDVGVDCYHNGGVTTEYHTTSTTRRYTYTTSRVYHTTYPYRYDTSQTQIRLVDGPNRYSGRVEVYYHGNWGTVCDDSFDNDDARVICRMIGYTNGYAVGYQSAHYGSGTGPITIDDLQCQGYENDIRDCSSTPWLDHNCGHGEDAGVDCYDGGTSDAPTTSTTRRYTNGGTSDAPTTSTTRRYTTAAPTSPPTTRMTTHGRTQIRLVNGTDSYSGRVEVYYHGNWGTLCDDYFDNDEARVVCRMLGYTGGHAVAYGAAYFGQGYGPITIDKLRCSGYETDIRSCPSSPWLSHDCTHSEDAGVDCYGQTSFTTEETPMSTGVPGQTQIRLVNGRDIYSGRVEVYYHGNWGTVCDDAFDDDDARVICRMLGYSGGHAVAYGSAHFGQGHGPITIDSLACQGYESDIRHCSSQTWLSHDCSHSEDAGVDCYGAAPITSQPYHTSYSITDAVSVGCDENGWRVRVNMYILRRLYPLVVASDIYLGDNSCTGYESGGILTFQQGLRQCLTSEVARNITLVYSNQLVYAQHDPVHPFIIRNYVFRLPIECDVDRNETSIGHIHHGPHSVTTPTPVVGHSHYSVSMAFYLDPNFQQEIRGYPLQVAVGERVYVKVFTQTADWTVKMRVHTCYTKPSQTSASNMRLDIIKDGCEMDTNTHLISQSSHETRFVFQDFEYTSNSEGIYLFCDATFCDTNDYSNACLQSCNP